jgi:hypothetical protein
MQHSGSGQGALSVELTTPPHFSRFEPRDSFGSCLARGSHDNLTASRSFGLRGSGVESTLLQRSAPTKRRVALC